MTNKTFTTSPSLFLITTQILLSIICLVHLLVVTSFFLHSEIPPWLFPATIAAVIGSHFLFSGKLAIDNKNLLNASFISLLIIAVSLFFSWFYFDFSWDGQWYHQAAIYNLVQHWNPMVTPLETPDKLNHTSILHFPKSSWYFAAAVLRLFGTVEMGKAYNIIALFAAFGIVYTLFRDLTQSAVRSLVLTVLVLLNPVIWSEITTYLNDGDLYLFLVTYLAAIILWLRDPKPAYVLIGSMAVICLVNIKFTGLVFFLGSSFFAFIYILIKKSHFTKKFLLSHLIAGIIAVGIFGFNPYVTNMLKRGHPLYPVMGSKEFPGVFDKGADDNEAYETPQNMKGKSFPVRLLYANFGRPGNAPYNDETEAILSNPFTSDLSSWTAYHFHETRVSGFGPYFGVALVLLIIALPILLIRGRDLLIPVLVFFAGLICCMALSKHFWWPRFFPMLWLAPIIPLILLWTGHTLADHRNKAGTIYGWLLALLIGVNGLIVAVTHMRWETTSSANLRSELQHIQETKQPIQIDYGWFNRSMEEKLKHWDIKYTTGPLSLADTAVHKLTSVVKGYPNQVLYRVK